MEYDVIKTIITVLIAGLGWAATHYFNSKRDRHLKRKEIVTAHLVNAFRVLTYDIIHRNLTLERKQKLESVISDIQLFGSLYQVELVKKLADDVIVNDEFLLDNLINNLRDDLRAQLGLGQIDGNVKWLRFDDDYKKAAIKNPQ